MSDAKLVALLREVRGYLRCIVGKSMSRNNAEELALELVISIDAALAAAPNYQSPRSKGGWQGSSPDDGINHE